MLRVYDYNHKLRTIEKFAEKKVAGNAVKAVQLVDRDYIVAGSSDGNATLWN